MAASGTDKNLRIGDLRGAKIFNLDDYGADNTGAALSDTAWANCYSDASAAVQAQGGSVIVLGGGLYSFSVNKIAVTDGRIGFIGQGRTATTIQTTGNNGTLVQVNSLNGGPPSHSAPVGGFTAYGWPAGNNVNGIQYGDRPMGQLVDVAFNGFNGSGSRGYWFRDTTGLSEGSFMVCQADQNTVNYDFDTSGGTIGSFDWSHFFFHCVCSTAGGNNAIALRIQNGQKLYGASLHLAGAISATTGLTSTGLVVGNSTSDTAYIQNSYLNIALEGDTSAGTIKDAVIQGQAGYGISKCHGQFIFPSVTGTFSAGSVTSPAVFTAWGTFVGPLFTTHGTLTSLGSAASGLSTYSG